MKHKKILFLIPFLVLTLFTVGNKQAVALSCGDGVCSSVINENYTNCPEDCAPQCSTNNDCFWQTPACAIPTCDNGTCVDTNHSPDGFTPGHAVLCCSGTPTFGATSCPGSGGSGGPVCGDGVCNGGENSSSCPVDCPILATHASCINNACVQSTGASYDSCASSQDCYGSATGHWGCQNYTCTYVAGSGSDSCNPGTSNSCGQPTADIKGTSWTNSNRNVPSTYNNTDGPMVLTPSQPFQLSWVCSNAFSAYIDNTLVVPPGSGSNNTYNAGGNLWSHLYTLTCYYVDVGAVTDTISASVPAQSCTAPTTGTVTTIPSTVTAGSNYEVTCDYGSANDYIPAPTNPPPGCTWPGPNGGHIGSAATFSCTAPNGTGTYTVTCQAQNQSGFTNFCSQPPPAQSGNPGDPNGAGGSTLTVTSLPVNASCGTANKNYAYNSAGYGSDTFCASGSASPASPAFPAQGSSVGWTCLGQGGGNNVSCSATRSSAPLTQYSVTVIKTVGGSVSSNDGGISCGSTCSKNYNQNSTVTLQATPTSIYWKFAGWTGDCSGTGSCVLTVNAAKTVSAVFVPRPFQYQEF